MIYLKKFNEKLSVNDITECFIDSIDDGFTFKIISNEPYSDSKITLMKILPGVKFNQNYTSNQTFRCIITSENIGFDRNIIGWRNGHEVELNDLEKSTILKVISGAEKLIMLENKIKEIRITAEYGETMDNNTYEILNCIFFTLYQFS